MNTKPAVSSSSNVTPSSSSNVALYTREPERAPGITLVDNMALSAATLLHMIRL